MHADVSVGNIGVDASGGNGIKGQDGAEGRKGADSQVRVTTGFLLINVILCRIVLLEILWPLMLKNSKSKLRPFCLFLYNCKLFSEYQLVVFNRKKVKQCFKPVTYLVCSFSNQTGQAMIVKGKELGDAETKLEEEEERVVLVDLVEMLGNLVRSQYANATMFLF